MTTAEDIKKYVANAVKNPDPDSRPIYVIMLFEHPAKELVYEKNGVHSGFPDLGRTDEPGFYYDVDTAVRAMHENACDIRGCIPRRARRNGSIFCGMMKEKASLKQKSLGSLPTSATDRDSERKFSQIRLYLIKNIESTEEGAKRTE